MTSSLTTDSISLTLNGDPRPFRAGATVADLVRDIGLDPAKGIEKVKVEGSKQEAVWNQLKLVFDPEIPVNVVDLGLIYDCDVRTQENGTNTVLVKMTLTAPGCGMGPTIAADARSKILALEGIDEADVELVWDPAWNQSMISEAGKMKLGIL